MGFEDREYFRNEPSYGAHRSWGVTEKLIIINVCVFALQLVLTTQGPPQRGPLGLEGLINGPPESLVTHWFALDVDRVLHGEIWRLTTYDFLHSEHSLWHIFWNMFVLYQCGRVIEHNWMTSREFLWFFLAAGALAGVAAVIWYRAMHNPFATVLGASGAVSACFAYYATKRPYDTWTFFMVLPIQARWLFAMHLALDLYPMLLQLGGRPPHDNVAHAAHIGGALFGYLYLQRGWQILNLVGDWNVGRWWRQWRARRRFSVVRDEEPVRPRPAPAPVSRPSDPAQRSKAELDREVDQILQKIQDHGQDSLTPRERETLTEASRRYRGN